MSKIQNFVRGMIIDPELEKKAHRVADEMHATTKEAQATVKKASAVLDKADDVKGLLVVAGVGLIVAGFVAGYCISKKEA